MTVSFFVHLQDSAFPNSPSTIKFGSWDPVSIPNGASLTMIRTAEPTSWDLKANRFKLGKSDDDAIKFDAIVRIDPGLPYLYLPASLYATFVKFIEKAYHSGVCVPAQNVCKFQFPCATILNTFGKSSDFEFRMYDVLRNFSF
jgi:hypothetical protein